MADASIKQYVFRKGSRQGIPVSGTFELTPRCNLSCKMCYIHAPARDEQAMQRELSARQWLRLGRQAVDAGMIYLLLTGGEPLLRPDFPEIYEGLAEMGVVLTVNTNATVLTPRLLALFQRHPPEKVNVTLYGMSRETYGSLCGSAGGFDLALKNIRTLKQAGIHVNLNTTFTRENLGDMERIIAFAKEERIPVRMASYLFPPVRGGSGCDEVLLSPEEMGAAAARFDYLTLEQEKRASRAELIRGSLAAPLPEPAPDSRAAACTAGRGSFWITWEGTMSPCGMLTQAVDVREQDFLSAWQQTRETIKGYLLPRDCGTCRYQAVCPSCVAVSACDATEGEAAPEQLCRRTKTYITEFLRYAEQGGQD